MEHSGAYKKAPEGQELKNPLHKGDEQIIKPMHPKKRFPVAVLVAPIAIFLPYWALWPYRYGVLSWHFRQF
jgi:hypothetical protein